MGEEDLNNLEAKPASGARVPFLVEGVVFVALGLLALCVYLFFIREDRPPNVILISIDTLRADHVGSYGYEHPTTPNLDRLAKEGVRFDQARSSTSWTLPAHMSLLTGLPDDLHEVVLDHAVLDPERTLLAETFKEAGYATGGFFGGPYLHSQFGFDRGFDLYQNCGKPTVYDLDKKGVDPATLNQLLIHKEIESHRIRTAPTTEAAAEDFIDRHHDEPFFLFVHHWDTHYDFNAPADFVKLFAAGYSGNLSMRDFIRNPNISRDMTQQDYRYLMACYDAEIRWVDHHVGLLLRKLEELDITDNTIVVVTSDHGEEFFEHGNKGHRQNLFDESLRVPLIMTGPGIKKGIEIHDSVRLYDVMPTILDLAGLPPVEDVYGVSLRPFLEVGDTTRLRDLPSIAELTLVPKVPNEEVPGSWKTPEYYYRHTSVGRGTKKYIEVDEREYDPTRPLDFQGPLRRESERFLFDLESDPGETVNLAEGDPQLLALFLKFRDAIFDGLRLKHEALPSSLRPNQKIRVIDPELLEQLRQNGYLGDDELFPAEVDDDGGG